MRSGRIPNFYLGFSDFPGQPIRSQSEPMTQSDCQTGCGFESGCWIAQPGTHTRTRASRTRPENRNRPTNEMAAMLSTSAFVGQRVVAAKTAAKVRPPISPEENLTFPNGWWQVSIQRGAPTDGPARGVASPPRGTRAGPSRAVSRPERPAAHPPGLRTAAQSRDRQPPRTAPPVPTANPRSGHPSPEIQRSPSPTPNPSPRR